MENNNPKTIYLMGGNEAYNQWRIQAAISRTGEMYGTYIFQYTPLKRKSVYILGGSEEGEAWYLRVEITENGHVHGAYFKYPERFKSRIRDNDRRWFKKHCTPIFNKYEIHHDWENGGMCYLVTHEEHKKIHKEGGKKWKH